MSVEIPEATESYEVGEKPVNGQQVVDQRLNGMSNGHVDDDKHKSKHKSSSKDKYRDKDRDKDHKSSSKSGSSRDKESSDKHKSSSSSKDKYKDKERDRDKDKSKSSSHKSSSRDKDKDKEREKDKERSKDKDKERDKERSKDRDKEKEKERDRDRDREKDKDKHRDKDRDKNKDRENDKDKDRKKDHKSSSSSSSHGKDRSKESSNKDRDKEKDRDKYKSSSSSSKDKHSSSSSSKSKDKDKEKYSSSRDKEKDRSRDKDKEKDRKDKIKEEIQTNGIKQEEFAVKEEPVVKNETHNFFKNDNEQQIDYKEPKREFGNAEFKNEYKEDRINSSQASSCDYSMSQFRDDEPAFVIKNERQEDSDFNIEDSRTQMDFTQNDDSQNGDSQNEDSQNAFNESDIKMEQNESDDEDNVPLAKRKIQMMDQSDDDVPLISRKKPKTTKKDKEKGKKLKKKRGAPEEDEEEDEKPRKKKVKKEKGEEQSPTKGRKKKEEDPEDVWRWWEEEKREDGVKWNFLEHKGPLFAPPYERLPDNVKFFYDGKQMKLSQDAEEIACFYAKMLNHDYVTKKVFNENFFKDWRKSMTSKEKETIRELRKCNFKEINQYFEMLSEKKKNKSKEEKLAIKEENEKLIKEYGFCTIDGHKERIGNFKIEPPGLFRGRGEHPKMGMVKRRVLPEDVFINCSKDSKIPVPPAGHKWREIRHDNTVTWLASWTENVQGQVKYVMLNPSSKLKGEKDYQKYEVARRLQKHIDEIRSTYREEWKSKEMRIRQRGVALYFIDKLALRAGNEKDEDQADTVGCCSLRVEHIALHKELNGKENVVVFDFLGKDSIRYYNEVEVEKRVFKNLELFMENKKEGDDLFDRLNTSILNEHLRDIMEGLTAKVFRTYNASSTLQKQLELLTDPNMSLPEKLLAYNRANRAVAILCNHQRAVPKSHAKSMENLKEKIRVKREQLDEAEAECDDLERVSKRGSVKEKIMYDKKKKQVERLKEQLKKLELQETDKDENKTIALSTSKLNYLDPRISVAWCKKFDVPIDKIYNKTQRDKFRWAIHMATEDFYF